MRVFLFTLVLFFALTLPLEAEDESRLRSDLSFQIQELEQIKPPLFDIIAYAKKEIIRVEKAKKEVKQYRDEVNTSLKNNLIKTLASGTINTLMELHGSRNAGRAVDLATWAIGKAIGLSMEKSTFFAGKEAFYTRKLEGISEDHRSLGAEIDKLYRMASSSDEAMKAYYNRYGKQPAWELGDTGTFIQRMRLIVEYAEAAHKALSVLEIHLNQMLESAQRDLKAIDRQIAILRSQLEELNRKDRDAQLEKNAKVQLSEEDERISQKPDSVEPSISVDPDMPQGCYGAKNRETHRAISAEITKFIQIAKDENDRLKGLLKERNTIQQAYLSEIQEKRNAIENAYQKPMETSFLYNIDLSSVENGSYPTGAPFDQMLEDTRGFHDAWMLRLKTRKDELQALADTILEGIDTEALNLQIAQGLSNINAAVGRYARIRRECLNEPEQSAALIRTGTDNGIVSSYPFITHVSFDFIETLKSMKLKLLEEVAETQQTIERQAAYHEDKMTKLRKLFDARRNEMQEEIARYQRQRQAYQSNQNAIRRQVSKLRSRYQTSLFTPVSSGSGTLYQLNFDVDLDAGLCAAISQVHKQFAAGPIADVAALERQVATAYELSIYYGRPAVPVPAFVEMKMDWEAEQKELDRDAAQAMETRQRYNNMRSNIQTISEHLQNDNFFMLGQLYPDSVFHKISSRQQDVIKQLAHSLGNLKTELTNALSHDRVHALRLESFEGQYRLRLKEFEENLACRESQDTIAEKFSTQLEVVNELLGKLSQKPRYINPAGLFTGINALLAEVETFYIDDTPAYEKTYKRLMQAYEEYDQKVNSVNAGQLISTDKTQLNTLLRRIDSLLAAHTDHMRTMASIRDTTTSHHAIQQLYEAFARHYGDKDLYALTALLADDWVSGSDGADLMDLEDTLSNSFSLFDEISCQIEGLTIQPIKDDRFSVSYTITIEGYSYANDIRHTEKTTVTEEVRMTEDGRAVIARTTGGRFWPAQ